MLTAAQVQASDIRTMEVYIIGEMCKSIDKNRISAILLSEREVDGQRVSFLRRTIEELYKSGAYFTKGSNTHDAVKEALDTVMREFFDVPTIGETDVYSAHEQLQAG